MVLPRFEIDLRLQAHMEDEHDWGGCRTTTVPLSITAWIVSPFILATTACTASRPIFQVDVDSDDQHPKKNHRPHDCEVERTWDTEKFTKARAAHTTRGVTERNHHFIFGWYLFAGHFWRQH